MEASAERLVARVAGDPLQADRVGVGQIRRHRVDEGVVARMDADLRGHLASPARLARKAASRISMTSVPDGPTASRVGAAGSGCRPGVERKRIRHLARGFAQPPPEGADCCVRVLFSSTRGAGHFNPLVPFARAFERAGHELRFAGPPIWRTVEAAGLSSGIDPPPEDEFGPIWARVPELPPEQANEVVVRELFGRLNTTAALPRFAKRATSGDPTSCCGTRTSTRARSRRADGIAHGRIAISLRRPRSSAAR